MDGLQRTSTKTRGLFSATALKCFALVCMTLDHLAAYGSEIPLVGTQTELLHRIGRIAAPLFLYFVVESMKHTRGRKRFVLRLYCAAVLTGLCGVLVSALLFDSGVDFGNIFHAFVWTTGTILVVDGVVAALKDKKWSACARLTFGYLVVIAAVLVLERLMLRRALPTMGLDIFSCFVVSPLRADYSILFILLGVAWYYMRTKAGQSLVLLALCLASFFGGWVGVSWLEFIQGYQWTMIGAIPAILLYNGARGKGWKWFFYLYYPLHMYVIAVVNRWVSGG